MDGMMCDHANIASSLLFLMLGFHKINKYEEN